MGSGGEKAFRCWSARACVVAGDNLLFDVARISNFLLGNLSILARSANF